MDEWTSAILNFTQIQGAQTVTEIDELFDRALVHTTKFKKVENLLNDTLWLIDRFPDYSVCDLIHIIVDADQHKLLARLHSGNSGDKLAVSCKQELLNLVAESVRTKLGIGNILADLARPKIARPVSAVEAATQVKRLVMTLFPVETQISGSDAEIVAALKLVGILSRLDDSSLDSACSVLSESFFDDFARLPDDVLRRLHS